jgi:hypothetical protein
VAAAPGMSQVRLRAAFRRYLQRLPEEAAAVPSMMSESERQFLFGIARDYYGGEGLIVDAGLFMGASTRCFGAGLLANAGLERIRARWAQPLVSMELGIVNPGMLDFFERNGIREGLRTGDSFVPLLQRNIAPVAPLVDLRIGDMRQTGRVESPIEILFLDVLKLPAISEFAIREYFPKLIPGRSLVIQQDYFIDKLPYIKVHQEFFRDRFEFVGEISSSAVFRCMAPVGPDAVAALFDGGLDAAAQLQLAAAAIRRSADPRRRLLMALSRLRLLQKLRGVRAASNYLLAVEQEYAEQIAEAGNRRIQDALVEARALCGPAAP